MEHKKNEVEQAELRPHSVDGIQEYDNKLPLWWVYLFYATIVFGVIYMMRFHVFGGESLVDEWKADAVAVELLHHKPSAQVAGSDTSESDDVEKGKEVYASTCASCHGAVAQGGIGPNLVDDYWIHGTGKTADIQAVVRDGAPGNGMPAWGAVIGETKVAQVVAFIESIAGSNPEGAKAPQGDFYAREIAPDPKSQANEDSSADHAEGKSIYETNCSSCHGIDGGGVIGPNLVDEYWLHGGKTEQISKAIDLGIPEKGMIAWGPILGPKKVRSVVSYIKSIQGSSPKNPKPPQGDKEE